MTRFGWITRPSAVSIFTLIAFVTPIALAAFLSTMAFSSRVLPEYIDQAKISEQAIGLIGEVSKIMITLSCGLSVGSIALFNKIKERPVKPICLALLALAMVVAFTSIYSGLRFLFDLSRQISFIPYDLEPLRGRIYWQGSAMLTQVSALCALVVQANSDLIDGWRDGTRGGEQ